MARITGKAAHLERLARLTGPEADRVIGAALYAAGQMIEIDAEISITTGSVSGKNHKASAPGEAPNADTRALDTNIETVAGPGQKVTVASNAKHSKALEFGTSRMAARPFMRPAVQRNRKAAVALIAKAVKRLTQPR